MLVRRLPALPGTEIGTLCTYLAQDYQCFGGFIVSVSTVKIKQRAWDQKKKKKKLTPYEPEDHFAFLYGFLVQTKNYTVVHRDLFM